ncbi:MAG: ABC transporter substrate-binding protein [Halioglobus sp.]|nr:ABC transporter substrate-binding protein [Halioglobus sp.]
MRQESAARIVTLSPNLAELVFAVGAGEQLVGVSAFSNYPEAVSSLPLIGDAFMIDLEQLALLHADLLLAWESGTPARVVDELRSRGYRVEVLRTRRLQDVASALQKIGILTGHEEEGELAARDYQQGLRRLAEGNSGLSGIRVFYQVSRQPIYTVTGSHYVSELIELCGGRNIFADLGDLAPLVSEEAVLGRDPELLLASDADGEQVFEEWARWPAMSANRYSNHFLVPADWIGRPGPRLVDAGREVCARLQKGREQRAAAAARS